MIRSASANGCVLNTKASSCTCFKPRPAVTDGVARGSQKRRMIADSQGGIGGSVEAQLAKRGAVVAPSLPDLDPQSQVDPSLEELFQLDSRRASDFLQQPALFTDDDLLLRRPVDQDRRIDLE